MSTRHLMGNPIDLQAGRFMIDVDPNSPDSHRSGKWQLEDAAVIELDPAVLVEGVLLGSIGSAVDDLNIIDSEVLCPESGASDSYFLQKAVIAGTGEGLEPGAVTRVRGA